MNYMMPHLLRKFETLYDFIKVEIITYDFHLL